MDSTYTANLPSGKPQTGNKPRYATARNILALMLREMSTQYGRTPGGYIWALVQPIATIIFLSLAFSLLLRTPPLGTSFMLFYTSGYLVLHFFRSISTPVAKSIHFSKQLLRYPAVNWMDAMLARFFLNTLTGIALVLILFTGVLIYVNMSTVLELPLIVEAFALSVLLGFAVGTVNCTLFGLFPIWEVCWNVLSRPLFIGSGLIFLFEDVPPRAQEILWYNPLFHLTGLVRAGTYTTYDPTYINTTYVLVVSLVLLTLGLIITKRYNREILGRL